jgi:hypothetical protein
MRSLLTLAAALLAPALLLTACGDSTSIADPPVAPSSTSPSPSHPPKRETPQHFIRRWAAIEKNMENSGKTYTYLSLSAECDACRRLARTIRSYYSAGGFVRWGGWRIRWIHIQSKRGSATTFAVRNRSMPTKYRVSTPGPLRRLAGGVTTQLLQLRPSQGSWQVAYKAELAS